MNRVMQKRWICFLMGMLTVLGIPCMSHGQIIFVEGQEITVQAIVAKVLEVTIHAADDTSFSTPLTWADMLPHGQALGVKVAFSRDLLAVEPLKHMVEVRVFTEDTETNWRPVPVDTENAKIVGNELRITLSWNSLVTLGLIPAQLDDTVEGEFVSVDYVRNAESNDHDSNAFHQDISPASLSRGKARRYDLTGQNGNETALVAELNDAFLKAGGVKFIQFRALATGGAVTSSIRQIQDQADILYYSGHGSHDGKYITYGATEKLYAVDVELLWKDIDMIIIAGCSVLDINDYKDNATHGDHPINHHASPGEEWLKAGPKKLLGYNYTAPLDTQGGNPNATKLIVDSWFTNGGVNKAVDAWMNANATTMIIPQGETLPRFIGTNACAIDLTQTIWEYKYLFKIPGSIFPPKICTVQYDEQNKKWPEEGPVGCVP